MKQKVCGIVSILFYLAAIGFFTAYLITRKLPFVITALVLMCIGVAFLLLAVYTRKRS